MLEKIKELAKRFCSIAIDINPHKSIPQTVERWISDQKLANDDFDDDCPLEIQKEMIAQDSIVVIYCYTSSVGHYYWIHYDIDYVIDEAFKMAEKM